MARPRPLGINHVALAVDDLGRALEFYGAVFDVTLDDERTDELAFIDLGDQFLALAQSLPHEADGVRHFGLAVDDKEAVREAAQRAGARMLPGRRPTSLDFLDPFGNRVQVVQYDQIEFTKDPRVLQALQGRPDAVEQHRAVATFSVDSFEPRATEEWSGAEFGMFHLRKTFVGEIEGSSVVRMISASTAVATSRAYTAFEHLSVSIRGRAGTFVLQHAAAAHEDPERGWARWTIVPDSGTGALVGIVGSATIEQADDGTHSFTLEYRLEHRPE